MTMLPRYFEELPRTPPREFKIADEKLKWSRIISKLFIMAEGFLIYAVALPGANKSFHEIILIETVITVYGPLAYLFRDPFASTESNWKNFNVI